MMKPALAMRIVCVAHDRWSLGVEHPGGHVVLVPIIFRTYEEAHRALVAWALDELMSEWPI